MKFSDVLSVLSGLAIFLYGMEVMGNGFKHMAGSQLQDFLEKLTKKPIVALLAGLLVTALVQSSGATTSMLVSFVNAGIMKVTQTVYVILGANIGTTITGHLMALDVGLVAPFIAFIGVCLIMFVKNDKLNAIGEIMMGLGFVFIGMETMSTGLAPLGQSQFFLNLLTSLRNPILGILVGFALTTIVQSSSASLGIIQSLAKSGIVGIKDVMFFNLGQNIGSCTTAMLASLSFNRDAKRVSIINLTFNIINATLFTVLYLLFPFDHLYETLAPGNVVEQIALMHTFTNIFTSAVCFPIAKLIAKIAYLIIPDHGTKKSLQPEITQAAKIEDNAAFNIFGINIEINNMFEIVKQSIYIGFNSLLEHYSVVDAVRKNEEQVNRINKGIYNNLMLLMASDTNKHESKQAASLFLAAGFAAFFTGVTEPLEFAFMFVAPALYIVHAVLTGISMAVAALFHWTAGFGFSAGFVDFFLSSRLPLANQPYMLLVQGLVFAVIYYFVFRFMIVKFNLKTPGREDETEEAGKTEEIAVGKDKFHTMAVKIYEGLGGDDNVVSVDNCITRLRVEVKDMDAVDQDKIKATGVPGINVVGKHSIQVVVGTQVQFVADEVNKLRK